MPWKIHNAEFEPGNPFVHMHDPRCELHLVTSLSNGTVEVFIGSDEPATARLFVRVSEDGPSIERASKFDRRDIMIVTNVLETLGIEPRVRTRLFARYHRELDSLIAVPRPS